MSFSTGTLKVETSDGRNFTLLEGFSWVSQDGTRIDVPAGATSDGASTPQALWSIGFAPFGSYWMAAFLHDFLYRFSGYAKSSCDSFLLEAMHDLNVPGIISRTIYEGVTLGGSNSFATDRAAQALHKS